MRNNWTPEIVPLWPADFVPHVLPSTALLEWMALPRMPILASPNPMLKTIIDASLTGQPVEFVYVGGTTPGKPRRLNVSLVFRNDPHGRVYVAGYCQDRRANRVFALDLMMIFNELDCA